MLLEVIEPHCHHGPLAKVPSEEAFLHTEHKPRGRVSARASMAKLGANATMVFDLSHHEAAYIPNDNATQA